MGEGKERLSTVTAVFNFENPNSGIYKDYLKN